MSTNTTATNTTVTQPDLASRVLKEGYGPGAWHGPDLKSALADVTPSAAHWRPAAGRHSIAEVALHHAYYVHSVRTRLSEAPLEPFVLTGDDWFEVPGEAAFAWSRVLETVETEQRLLAELAATIETGTKSSPLADAERFDLILGITCHAVYHAGQIQLIKRLRGKD